MLIKKDQKKKKIKCRNILKQQFKSLQIAVVNKVKVWFTLKRNLNS